MDLKLIHFVIKYKKNYNDCQYKAFILDFSSINIKVVENLIMILYIYIKL